MAYDRTAQRARLFDRERARLLPDATLVLVLNAGTGDQADLAVDGGWFPFKEHKFGEVNSVYKIEITDRDGLTAEVMGEADRLRLDGALYQFNYDPPLAEPRVWTLYAEELKTGGMR